MDWQDWLNANTKYIECRNWLLNGTTEADAWAQCAGADVLWFAQERGYITSAAAARVAAVLVGRTADVAPDVGAVVDAVQDGDVVLARHEVMATEAVCADHFREATEMVEPGAEPVIPCADTVPGADKARYAASLLVAAVPPWLAATHAARVPVDVARRVWADALRDKAGRAELAILEQGIAAAEQAEKTAQADFVRWLVGDMPCQR